MRFLMHGCIPGSFGAWRITQQRFGEYSMCWWTAAARNYRISDAMLGVTARLYRVMLGARERVTKRTVVVSTTPHGEYTHTIPQGVTG